MYPKQGQKVWAEDDGGILLEDAIKSPIIVINDNDDDFCYAIGVVITKLSSYISPTPRRTTRKPQFDMENLNNNNNNDGNGTE